MNNKTNKFANQCRHYDENKDSCPFAFSCLDNCYFAYKYKCEQMNDYNELQEEIEHYSGTEYEYQQEIKSLKEDLDWYKQENERLEKELKDKFSKSSTYKKLKEENARISYEKDELVNDIIAYKEKYGDIKCS